MSIIQAVRDAGFRATFMALFESAGQCVRKCNPLRYLKRAPIAVPRRAQQECVWIPPSSRQ